MAERSFHDLTDQAGVADHVTNPTTNVVVAAT